jgi:predicted MFS family arabinose efflux permease
VLCTPIITFAPVLVKEVFAGNAAHFSIAMVSFGAGGLLGALALLSIPAAVDRRMLSSVFAIAYGVALILTALDPWFWGLPLLLGFAGAAMTISNTAANSVLQTTSDAHVLGQTVSLYMLAMRGGISIGALLTGATVTLLGVQHALLLNGVVAVVVQAGLAYAWLRASLPTAEPV